MSMGSIFFALNSLKCLVICSSIYSYMFIFTFCLLILRQDLTLQSRLGLNSRWFSCSSLQIARITEMSYHAWYNLLLHWHIKHWELHVSSYESLDTLFDLLFHLLWMISYFTTQHGFFLTLSYYEKLLVRRMRRGYLERKAKRFCFLTFCLKSSETKGHVLENRKLKVTMVILEM